MYTSLDAVNFSSIFNDKIKRLTTVLDNYQCHENNEPINDPDEFIKMIETRDPELIGFFEMLYQSMNPVSKNPTTLYNLKKKVMILCYQMAGLRNKQVTSAKKKIGLYLSSSGTSASTIDTLSNLGFTTTYKTVTREKKKIVKSHEKRLLEYLRNKV